MTGKYISTKLLLKQILLDLVLKFMVQDSLMKKAQNYLLYYLIPFLLIICLPPLPCQSLSLSRKETLSSPYRLDPKLLTASHI